MTVAATPIPVADQQHIVLEDVSWDFYERLLREIGDRPLRVTYDDGRLEIMSPLPKHELWGWRIGRLLEMMCFELDLPLVGLGSTTFRNAAKKKGLEPDECYYISHAAAAREMDEAFDPGLHPPPDLAIEVDITNRSIEREPIYAALGVPELWRFDQKGLKFFGLAGAGFAAVAASLSFPFLKPQDLQRFLSMFATQDENAVLREFQRWVRSLPR